MKVNFIQVGQSKVIVIYIVSLYLILNALRLFVATGIGTTGLGIGIERALAIDIDMYTHAYDAFVLGLTPSHWFLYWFLIINPE